MKYLAIDTCYLNFSLLLYRIGLISQAIQAFIESKITY